MSKDTFELNENDAHQEGRSHFLIRNGVGHLGAADDHRNAAKFSHLENKFRIKSIKNGLNCNKKT